MEVNPVKEEISAECIKFVLCSDRFSESYFWKKFQLSNNVLHQLSCSLKIAKKIYEKKIIWEQLPRTNLIWEIQKIFRYGVMSVHM